MSKTIHRNESLCTKSKEKTRRALKILRFFRHFSTTRTYLGDNRERERGPIVSVGVDPTAAGTFWPRLTTFDVHNQITIATRRQTSICPSCESPTGPTLSELFHQACGVCEVFVDRLLFFSFFFCESVETEMTQERDQKRHQKRDFETRTRTPISTVYYSIYKGFPNRAETL